MGIGIIIIIGIHCVIDTCSLQDANAWALVGHTHYLTGDYSSAKDAYERTINYVHLHVHVVYLRLADIYLKEKEVKSTWHTFSILTWQLHDH